MALDGIAISMLLGGREAELKILGDRTRRYLDGRIACPACGSMGPHDSHAFDLEPNSLEFVCVCGEIFVVDITVFLKTGAVKSPGE